MAKKTKAKKPAQDAKEDPKAIRLERRPSESEADTMAHTSLRPTVQAALTLMDYNKVFGEMSATTLVEDLVKQCELASDGDLRRAEALLIAQAHTLDSIFHVLARRAQRGEYLNQLEVNLRLALKAQSQCRATLETLATIKNPRPVNFVQQANIAHGPQQVNNGATAHEPDTAWRARETEDQPNKLLEVQHGDRLERGTPGTASRTDTPMEAVESVQRAKDG